MCPLQVENDAGIRDPVLTLEAKGYLLIRSHSGHHDCDSQSDLQSHGLPEDMEMLLPMSTVSHKSPHLAIPAGVVGDNESIPEMASSCLSSIHHLSGWPATVLSKGLDIVAIFGSLDNRGLAECGPLQPGD